MQSNIKLDAQRKTTINKEPLKRYTAKEYAIVNYIGAPALVGDTYDDTDETYDRIVGMTTVFPHLSSEREICWVGPYSRGNRG